MLVERSEAVSAAMLEFLEWVRFRPRTHADAMEAWASHCPRFTLWEDALEQEFIALEPDTAGVCWVRLTDRGLAALRGR
jgi:hypothetical protein